MGLKRNTILVGLLGTTVFSACSNSQQSPADALVTVMSASVQNLEPLFATDANVQHLNQLIQATLVRVGHDLRPEPYLAESFSVVKDGIVFKLRAGCLFQNAQPVTVADAIASVEQFRDDKNQSPFQKSFSVIQKVEALDSDRFKLVVDPGKITGLLYDLSLLSIRPKTELKNPALGAGPYRVVKFSTSGIELERANPVCIPNGKTKRVIAKVIRDDISRFLKLQRGEVDLVINDLDYRKVQRIAEGKVPGLGALSSDGTTISYMGLNQRKKELRDPRVRRAITLALDLPAIIQFKLAGYGIPAASLLSPQSWFSNPNLKPLDHNVEEARRLLDEAGFNNGKNQKPVLRLSLKTTTYRPITENARAIKAQLKEVGVEVDHQAYEWGTFYADVKSRNTELFLLRWVGVASPDLLRDVYHSENLALNNRTDYKNPAMDRLLDQANSTLDPEKKRSALWAAQELAQTDLPSVLLWYNKNAAAFRNSIKNLKLSPNGDWYPLIQTEKVTN